MQTNRSIAVQQSDASPQGQHGKPLEPIPGVLNLVLLPVMIAVLCGLLWLVSHTSSWLVLVLAAIAFSFFNNTMFSLLHESVHGIFHGNRTVNEWCGRLASAFFPTALEFQRIFHLGHHQRNRTEVEQFDYYRPEDNKIMKYLQWYGILTGIYWVFSPAGCLIYLLCPWSFKIPFLSGSSSQVAKQSGARAMLSGFEHANGNRIRLEILFSILVQIMLFIALDLTFLGWACCYAAFAVNWSSLQYADHAWSELHVYDGAWNLKVNPIVQFIFLNYHHHRAHHQHPSVPWLHLHRYVDKAEDRPAFIKVYLSMWRGPRPLPDNEQVEPTTEGGADL